MTDGILRSVNRGSTVTQTVFPMPEQVFTGILLDDYPNALAAFSMRKLRAAYAGSALRLRNENGGAETDIGFSGNDFDAAAAAAHLASPPGNGFVTTWYDQSGNGYDVTQATGGSQPRYQSNNINSMPGLRIDASGTMHFMRTNIPTAGSSVLSAFGVGRPGGGAFQAIASFAEMSQANDYNNDFSIVILGGNNAATALMVTLSSTDSGQVAFAGGGVPFRTAAFKQASGTFWITQDGIAGTTASDTLDLGGPTSDLCRLVVGARWTGSGISNYWDGGDIGEVVFYLADRSADLAAIDTNQADYWGL